MPPAHGLGVFERDYVTDDSVSQEEFAEEDVMWTITEDVADGEDCRGPSSGGLEGSVYGETIVQRECEGFLAEDVELQWRDGFYDLDVCFVQCADEDAVYPDWDWFCVAIALRVLGLDLL